MRENGPEPIIVQIKESLRLSDDLDNRLNEFASTRGQNKLNVLKWWAGSKLLVLLSFPSDFTEQQALTVIGRLERLPAVEKVVAASAFNLHFRSGDFVRAYGANDRIPDVARRGFDAERIDRPPPRIRNQLSLDLSPHVPNRLIVAWKDEYIWKAASTGFTRVMEDFHRNAGCRVVREIRYSPTKLVQVLEFDDPSTLASKLRRYVESGLVVYAQPDFVYQTTAAPPNDPWYAASPGPQWTLPIIKAEQAWDMTTGDPSVIIAVADSGARVNGPTLMPGAIPHPDFKDNIWSEQDNGDTHNFIYQTTSVDDDLPGNHGSAVASIIGAQGNNGLDMTGVAWDTSLMILKVVASDDHSSTDAVAEAITYAADHGATAINLSVGFYSVVCDNQGTCSDGGDDDAIFGALEYARNNNMVTVCAAGNGAAVQFPDGSHPADNDLNVNRINPASIPTDNNISVLATKRNDQIASYSSYGKYRVDLAAPGGESNDRIPGLFQTFHDPPTSADRNVIYGTSAAAPHVAGALALIKSFYSWEDYAGIRDRVLMGTETTGTLDGKCRTNGRLNLYKALQPRSMLLNLSTRAKVGAGDQAMIGGFYVKGSGTVKVVIRGLGPSLPSFGVPKLGDPKLRLTYSNGTGITSNDDYGNLSQQDKNELSSLGLTPSDPHEAALIWTLSAGGYTAIVESQDGQY